jgi:hypothetical protein
LVCVFEAVAPESADEQLSRKYIFGSVGSPYVKRVDDWSFVKCLCLHIDLGWTNDNFLEMKFTAILALLAMLVATAFAQKELNQKSFDAEVGGNNNVFVKFFAPWCKLIRVGTNTSFHALTI